MHVQCKYSTIKYFSTSVAATVTAATIASTGSACSTKHRLKSEGVVL